MTADLTLSNISRVVMILCVARSGLIENLDLDTYGVHNVLCSNLGVNNKSLVYNGRMVKCLNIM